MSFALIESSGTLRPMLRLAAPVLAEQALLMLVGFSDTLLTGHYLDKPHLAAINLMAYALWLITGMFALVAIGATAMVARFVGAGDLPAARRVLNQALLIGAVPAVAAMLIGLFWGDRLVLAMQLESHSAALAARYLRFIVPALPLVMLEVVGIACLRGAGDMVSGLIAMAVVNAVNIAVSWMLVLGVGPLPALGWEGLAVGTMSGYLSGAALIGWFLLRGRAGLKIDWRRLAPDFDLIRRLLRIGLPGGADVLSIIGCQLWFVAMINQLGDLAAAAHGVAVRTESLAFLPGVAFQVAAGTMAGQYLGARDHHRAGRSVLMACLVGGGIMAGVGVLLFAQALPMAALFVRADQLDVAELAAPLLRTVAVAMPALALTMILSGALRGAGDTRWPLAFSLIGFLGVRIPATYCLAFPVLTLPLVGWTVPGLGLGVLGAWYAMAADLFIRAGLVGFRFLHGGWKWVEV